VAVLDADADKLSRAKQGPVNASDGGEDDVNVTVQASLPGASLVQVTGIATLNRLIQDNKNAWGAVGSR